MSNRVYVFGDLHGSYKPIKDFYNCYKDNPKFNFDGTDTIILLGDAGLNYYFDHRDDNFKNALCKYPFTYFVIRGNHEQRPSIVREIYPQKWEVRQFWNNAVYVEKRCPKIKYALDTPAHYIIPLQELNCDTLVVPGAYSVDKEYRLSNGLSWFPQEQLSIKEKFDAARCVVDKDYHLILSHTAPLKYEPIELFLPMINQSEVDKSMEEFLDWVDDNTDYLLWIWGHYHGFKYYSPDKWDYGARRKLMLFQKEQIDLEDWLLASEAGKIL